MKLPYWFKQPLPDIELINKRFSVLKRLGLNTVCQSAHCPNMGSCFKQGTLTFMILGKICTGNCKFCAIEKNGQKNLYINYFEPINIARAVKQFNLDYALITSVSRDDLSDGGAEIFSRTIREIRRINSKAKIEVLVPDFAGSLESIHTVIEARPDVIAHNLETVPRLFKALKDKKRNYNRSLRLLREVKKIDTPIFTKSSLMLGLGETNDEVLEVMQDLRLVGCDIVTLGQYLRPSKELYPVKEYLNLEKFTKYQGAALSLGFRAVSSGPLVRSSYKAKELFERCMN